jgi:GH15 family glucan-1,4-alpha-glucosidase
VALDAAEQAHASERFHHWVTARVLAFEAPMRRAIEAVAIGREPDADDYLPCRFAASGHAPTDDGWGAFQVDGPGLWLWALQRHARNGAGFEAMGSDVRQAAAVAAEYVMAMWRRPSYDAWEEHPDALSTSTLAACLAGMLAAHRVGIELDFMQAAVEGMREELSGRGQRLGYLPKSDQDDAVDASLLWCGSLLGAFARSDRWWTAALERIETTLLGPDGGVHRYLADTFYGGGQWPVLTAAHGMACLERGGPGDSERARHSAAWIEAQRGAAGGLPEQSSDHALHPARLPEWRSRWGPVAQPLTWSHAMAILLRQAIDANAQ